MRALILALLGSLALGSVAQAGARRCGDDVNGHGRKVRCECGDVLVSGHTFTDADPITRHACGATALVVDIGPEVGSPTLAFDGHTLRGSGRGLGIQVLRGGATGLTITGPGTVTGFATGIQAPRGELAALTGVTSADNLADGFAIAGAGFVLTGCEATHNGRDGFALRGRGYTLSDDRAVENRGRGFAIAGRDASLGAGNEARGNGDDGIFVRGRGLTVERAVATGNGRRGLRARTRDGRIVDTTTTDDHRRRSSPRVNP